MTPNETAAMFAAIGSIVSVLVIGFRWVVKSWLSELKPNHGSSLKDQVMTISKKVDRLEERVDEIYTILIDRLH